MHTLNCIAEVYVLLALGICCSFSWCLLSEPLPWGWCLGIEKSIQEEQRSSRFTEGSTLVCFYACGCYLVVNWIFSRCRKSKTGNENSLLISCVAHKYNMFMKYCTMVCIIVINFFARSLFGSSNSDIICLGQKEQKPVVKECKPTWVAVFNRYHESFMLLDLSMSGRDLWCTLNEFACLVLNVLYTTHVCICCNYFHVRVLNWKLPLIPWSCRLFILQCCSLRGPLLFFI